MSPKLIVGLGNPGGLYDGTRHNVGFSVVESFAKRAVFSSFKKKFKSLFAEGEVGGTRVLVALPQTFMNLSGESVLEIVGFFKIDLSDLIVVHDELDLPVGKMKMIRKGGAAGNRGVLSIQSCLGTQEFSRLRIGIGKPVHKGAVSDFVLSRFQKEEESLLLPLLEKAKEGLAIWGKNGIDEAIHFCNSL